MHITAFLSLILVLVDCQFGSMVTRALNEDVNSLDITGRFAAPEPRSGTFGVGEIVKLGLRWTLLPPCLAAATLITFVVLLGE